MDTFVDKLAHRLTAQEMIKANSAAETEELDRLKGKVERYSACLKQMEILVQEMQEIENRLNGTLDASMKEQLRSLVEVGTTRMNTLADVSVAKLESIQTESLDKLELLQAESLKQLAAIQAENKAGLEQFQSESIAKLESFQAESIDLDAVKDIVDARADKLEENVHKECVKVYRNVQAVVNEESGKLDEAVKTSSTVYDGRLKGLMGVSAAALAMSTIAVILQILAIFGII